MPGRYSDFVPPARNLDQKTHDRKWKVSLGDPVEVIVLDNPWLEPQPPSKQGPSLASAGSGGWGSSRWIPASIAALITVVLHALLVGSLLLAGASRQSRPVSMEGLATAALNEEARGLVSAYVIVNDNSVTPPDQRIESVYAVSNKTEQLIRDALLIAIDAFRVPQIAVSDEADDGHPADEVTGNSAETVALFGRYMGQVKARIERAWSYPATPKKTLFSCTVQILQSKLGAVEEVTLRDCDFDPEWQMSLVHAIQAASPLSAPPNGNLFTESITLSFHGRLADRHSTALIE